MTSGVARVRERIAGTGRDPGEVRIVAVTKGLGVDAVHAAVAAGIVDIGENRAQELLAKTDAGVPAATRWHFLGTVQRNKVAHLAPHVALWHGVDRIAAGEAIARARPGAAVLVQVNISGQEKRPGCAWDAAADLVTSLRGEGLDVRGLMGVASPSAAVGEARTRAEFRRLSELGTTLGLDELSMGMSGDLEIAVEEGATIVRIGTTFFGSRPAPPPVPMRG